MRTEDLIHPKTRFEALVQLAEFVGARVTSEQLCCRSQQFLNDLGTSRVRDGGPRDQILEERAEKRGTVLDEKRIMARYGKWKEVLQNEPDLVTRLEYTGAVSLQAFGYEPSSSKRVRFMDESTHVENYDCAGKVRDGKLRCS